MVTRQNFKGWRHTFYSKQQQQCLAFALNKKCYTNAMSTAAKFNTISIFARQGVAGVAATETALRQFLSELAIHVVEPDAPADLMIVIGGDGSLLQASHLAINNNVPVLGINRGHLGFLTDIYPNEIEKVAAVLKGHYQKETRFLLETQVRANGLLLNQEVALNEVVLLPGHLAQMIRFEIYINNNFVCTQRADGLIVTTPTGSTAYALSGGGPILHPQLDAIALVPMFPHKLSSRPIVVDANSLIDILITAKKVSPHISCDGRNRTKVPKEATVHVRKHHKRVTLIHPADYDYYKTLREKLGWEAH